MTPPLHGPSAHREGTTHKKCAEDESRGLSWDAEGDGNFQKEEEPSNSVMRKLNDPFFVYAGRGRLGVPCHGGAG
jgi:hypothetical protein